MYMKNPNLRAEGEKIEMTQDELREYIKCKKNIFHFSKYFYITTENGTEPIDLYGYQKRLIKLILTKEKDRNNRIIMLPRQTGKTTIATLIITWYALFQESKTVSLLANKQAQADEILFRIKEAYVRLPLWLQQGIKKWNAKEVILENNVRLFTAASSSSSIRGKTVDLQLVDEFAHLDNNVAESFMRSVFPTQSSRPDGMLMLISTPNGMNHFYDIWKKAVEGKNSFVPAKVQWWEIGNRDEKWKEKQIRDNGIQYFMQEHACLMGYEEVQIIDENGEDKIIKIEELFKNYSKFQKEMGL